ncbi:ribonuclease P protein component [Epibacterium sp. SM1979]|uniref:Ribonuclease P protein component n=1 Tax=Tritonibacter litoralis TaxID=2662264 RepID=A0A843YI84_9RHOB|nr:ribonuclease P protein component [Tritonibacter litoralis]MQQ08457.1 ribonuclease P protein component [Tritonibacter litoralis]
MDDDTIAGTTPSAVSVCATPSAKQVKNLGGVEIIAKRSDFLLAARAKRQGTKAMMLQGRNRGDDGPARVGFTCSKKVGNAVARNRAKRRLREIARLVLPAHGRAGWDYVLIGRAEATASRDLADLQKDLIYALKKIHGPS